MAFAEICEIQIPIALLKYFKLVKKNANLYFMLVLLCFKVRSTRTRTWSNSCKSFAKLHIMQRDST